MSDRITIQIRSTVDFKDLIEKQAAKRNLSVSSHIRALVSDYERLNDVPATLKGADHGSGKPIYTVEELI